MRAATALIVPLALAPRPSATGVVRARSFAHVAAPRGARTHMVRACAARTPRLQFGAASATLSSVGERLTVSSARVFEREKGDGRTVVGDVLPHAGYAEIATLFAMHYDQIRAEHAKRSAPGLLAIGFDLGSAAITAQLWTKTRAEAVNAFTVGRHRECDLCLPKDPTISLRHLTVVAHPFEPRAESRIAFRILDLRTNLAFADCFGARLSGVIADGPTLIAVGRYALLLIPTGDGTRLPESATAGFGLVADPVYLDPRGRSSRPTDITEMHRTALSVIEGPARASAALVARSEEPLGTLEVTAEGHTRKLVVGPRAASQGLLLGCYDRCDDDRLSHVQHPSISRVHVLVLLHGESLYAIDTASTNGMFVHRDGKRVRTRLARLGPGLQVVLADDRARIVWHAED